MEFSRGQDALPAQAAALPPTRCLSTGAMSASVVLAGPAVLEYGRHAAPASAYGPTDLHRLLPVPAVGPPEEHRAEAEEAAEEIVDGAATEEPGATGEEAAGEEAAGEESTRSTGFWARLRLLPRSA